MENKKGPENNQECPFLSKRVVCANCYGPYNVDDGCITEGEEVFGGRCDECGGTVGLIISPAGRQKQTNS